MVESSNICNDKFKFEIRKININKEDYKDNPKEKFLFDYLSKSFYFFKKLDAEKGTNGVITKGDINIFLSSKDIQKKKITEDDVINFLNKVKMLNPTDKEQEFSQMNYVDENNQKVITDEIYDYFDKSTKSYYDLKVMLNNAEGNVKKGFELFDLNSDGKLDDVELSFCANIAGNTGYEQLKSFLSALDKGGSADGKSDNIITDEDKLKVYNNIYIDKLKNINIKNETGNNVVTPEILALFENGITEVKFDDLLNEDGSIKPGFELFDINSDGKIDDVEKSYFSSGGHAISDDTSILTIKNLLNALNIYDKFGTSKYGNNRNDDLITLKNSNNLYNVISSAHYLVDVMKDSDEFPENIRQMYIDALKEVYIGEYVAPCTLGICDGNYIGMNYHGRDKYDINAVVLHELTHYLLINKTGMGKDTYLMQEVETFYMEYKLHNLELKLERDNPDFVKAKHNPNSLVYYNGYIAEADEIKRKNPDISEKELALEAFLKTNYRRYENRYAGEEYNALRLRELVRKADNYVMLK